MAAKTILSSALNATPKYEEFELETGSDFFEVEAADNQNTSTDSPVGNPYILPWHMQLVYIVAFVSMVTVAAGGNMIVIWVVVAHKRMRTVINYFLVNLAVADTMISVLNTLFSFVYMLHGNWPFGRTYCRFVQFISPCTISASVFTFMAIAIDRYVAIIHPLKPRMGARLVLTTIVVIWLLSIVVALPSLLFAEIHEWRFNNNESRTVCYLAWPDETDGDNSNSKLDFIYNIFQLVVNYIAPLTALLVTYTAIGRQLWGSQAIGERTAGQEETIRSKRRVVRMMIVIVLIFAICWLPQHTYYVVVNLYPDVQEYLYLQHIYLVIYWVAMSNSMYNPFMYCWMNARFRSGFKYVFRWLPCVTWHPNDALGIGGVKCPKIVRLGVTGGAQSENLCGGNGGGGGLLRSVGGHHSQLGSYTSAGYRSAGVCANRNGGTNGGNGTGNKSGSSSSRCLLSDTQQTMLSHVLNNSCEHIDSAGSGNKAATGSGSAASTGGLRMQLRPVGNAATGSASTASGTGHSSPMRVREDIF